MFLGGQSLMSKQGNQPADWAAMFEEPCPRYDRDGWDAVFDWWYRIGQDKLGTLVNLAGHMGVAIQTLYTSTRVPSSGDMAT